jgi:hypothetical protein
VQDAHVKLNPALPWQNSIVEENDFFRQQILLNLREKLVKCYTWSIALYGGENGTLRKVGKRYLESFGLWCRRRVKISWTDCVRNEVLHRIKVRRNILSTTKRRKAD